MLLKEPAPFRNQLNKIGLADQVAIHAHPLAGSVHVRRREETCSDTTF